MKKQTEETKLKRSDKMKSIPLWNRGLTKYDDERIKKIGETNRTLLTGVKQKKETNIKRGIKMKNWWENQDNLEKIRERNNKISSKAGLKLLEKSESKLPSDIEKLYLIDQYSCEYIAKICGLSRQTINRWLHRMGIPLRKDIFKRGNIKIDCDDGHIVDSNFEREVDNWLYSHNIPHKTHFKVFNNRRFTSDFKIADILIECDGLMNKRIDKESFKEKINLYKENNIPFLILYPYEDIHTKLSILSKRYFLIQNKLNTIIKN